MKCIHFKVRSKKGNHYFYCSKNKSIITYQNCANCPYKEYKQYKPLCKRNKQQIKKDLARYSILYTNLEECCVCHLKTGQYDERIGITTHVDKNEVYEGAYRSRSIEKGMVMPLCTYCHNRFHNDIVFNLFYKVFFELEFLKHNDLKEFINIFGQDYRIKYKKVIKNKKDSN